MLLRNRAKPLPLRKLDAAIPRLSRHFPALPEMREAARIQQQGYTGELKVDFFLDNLASMYTILHDVYLRVNNKNFQIDALVIANHTVFIVDAKNYQGPIRFNTILKQLTRSDGKIESGFEYPITQVKNQKFHLHNWLKQHNFEHIPIQCFAAISDPATVVQVDGDQEEVGKYVVHAAAIPERIMTIDQQFGDNGATTLSGYQIGRNILSACGNFDMDLYKRYGMRPADLFPGVICPYCRVLGMRRVHGGWHCPKCQSYSKDAHNAALKDYFLLINNTLTNQECVRFLELTSRHVASRLLKQSFLSYDPKSRKWRRG